MMRRASGRLDGLHLIRRWTEEEGRTAVEGLRASGLGPEEFAARHKLHPVRVARWAARLAPRALSAIMPVDLVPARAASTLVELVLEGRILRVPADIDSATLARLIRVVEAV